MQARARARVAGPPIRYTSEPPKRGVSGWVVSWDPSFALRIKKHVQIVCLSALPQCLRRGNLRYPLTTHPLTTGFGRFKHRAPDQQRSQQQQRSYNDGAPGAKYYTPEIDTSEIIVDCQRHFPTGFHYSVVFSQGSSLVQWIFSGFVQWIFSGVFQWNHFCDFWCVICCPDSRTLRGGGIYNVM